jgi:hypothetical protein
LETYFRKNFATKTLEIVMAREGMTIEV